MKVGMKSRVFGGVALAAVLAGVAGSAAGAKKSPAGPPDFTAGGKPEDYHDYNLGPTGARGWIYGRGSTAEARQILVTKVTAGTPADGVLKPGDVILGVAGRPFDGDARIAFARAVTAAESDSGGGRLELLRWRAGRTAPVRLTLKVLGSFRDTTVDSPKARRIIEAGARHLAEAGLGGGVQGYVNALGLLATGEAKYLPIVRAHAAKVRGPAKGMASWYNGYANLFLTEYYLATQDRSVLGRIRELSRSLALGQNVLGLWGHGYAEADGTCSGYGALNQAGLVCAISLALAEKCGIDDGAVKLAVKRSRRCFSWYAGKGSIPYGYHQPWMEHGANGKNGLAAVFLDLAGDAAGASFFSKMCTAATAADRDKGHTGSYFNTLWGPLGAARAGDAAAAAHLKELRWLFDLARRADGGVDYQGNPGNVGGHKHGGWDCTGAQLLAYCTPRRKLYITGRGGSLAEQLTGEKLRQVVAAGKIDYDAAGRAELMRLLGSWSPVVRMRAAKALARKSPDVAVLVRLLRGPDRSARYGACRALEAMGGAGRPAVGALIAVLGQKDIWLRCRAVRALGGIGDARAIPALLKAAVREDPVHDPLQRVQNEIALTLFYTGSAMGIRTFVKSRPDALLAADRRLLIPALKTLLMNANGRSRSEVARFCERLPWKDIEPLLPELLHGAKYMPPGCKMFSWNAVLSPYAILCKYGVRQVLEEGVAEWMLLHNTGGAQHRWQKAALEGLVQFGRDGREYLPLLDRLEEHIRKVAAGYGRKFQVHKVIPPMIPAVRAALGSEKGHPTLRTLHVRIPGREAVKGMTLLEQER